MFAGRRRQSSNIRVMQLFHELKQQFPTVPDHIVSACISTHASTPTPHQKIHEILQAAALLQQATTPPDSPAPMGRSPPQRADAPPPQSAPIPTPNEPIMTESAPLLNSSDHRTNINNNNNVATSKECVTFTKQNDIVNVNCELQAVKKIGNSSFYVKRPDYLDLKPEVGDFSRNLQLSEKCSNVHKLLHSANVSDKPPRSPLNNKRLVPTPTRHAPLNRKETASTPTQTTDTLLTPPTVNLSVNVNCSMGVSSSSSSSSSPTSCRKTAIVSITPQQPWLHQSATNDQSPRSYTSVNLMLRPPSSEPQAPIDITSQNSSLTYSTSSFDSTKGLQSRLQITVGPGSGGKGGSSVASVRTRPRSSYHPEGDGAGDEGGAVRQAGSLNNLTTVGMEPPVILKQQARFDRLRIELRTEKAKLEVMQIQVAELEKKPPAIEKKVDDEVEKQLKREIKHLRYQCGQLVNEANKMVTVSENEDFYQNIYTGQRGRLNRDLASRTPGWNCHICTFRNHPALDECEQCQMPRIVYVSAAPGDNIHIHVIPRLSRRVAHSWVL